MRPCLYGNIASFCQQVSILTFSKYPLGEVQAACGSGDANTLAFRLGGEGVEVPGRPVTFDLEVFFLSW